MEVSNPMLEMLRIVTAQSANRAPRTDSGENDFRKLLSQAARPMKDQSAAQDKQPAPQTDAPEEHTDALAAAQALAAGMFAVPQIVLPQETAPDAAALTAEDASAALLAVDAAVQTPVQEQTLPADTDGMPKAAEETAAPAADRTDALTVQPEQPAQAQKDSAGPITLRQAEAQTGPEMSARQGGQEDAPELVAADAAPQQPFRDVEAVPIKVAETVQPEAEARPEEVSRQLVGQITTSLENGASKVEVRLTPEHLGDVTVELTRDGDGALHVVLTPERAATGELLERHITSLRTALGGNESEPVQITVQRQQNERQEQSYDGRGGQSHQGQQQEQQQREDPRRHAYEFLQQLQLGMSPAAQIF